MLFFTIRMKERKGSVLKKDFTTNSYAAAGSGRAGRYPDEINHGGTLRFEPYPAI